MKKRCGPVLSCVLFLGGCVSPDPGFGSSGQAISDGSIEDDAAFPWVVQVQAALGCSGVLIHANWVLTAAHCVRFDGQPVHQPLVSFTRDGVSYSTGFLPTTSVYINPRFPGGTGANDMALVRIPAFAPHPLLQPAELPRYRPAINESVVIASNQTFLGGPALPVGTVSVLRGPIFSVGTNLLGKSTNPEAARVCKGDSGSGVITQADGFNYVTAILAGSDFFSMSGECSNDTPEGNEFRAGNVYANLDWIGSIMTMSANADFAPKVQLYDAALDFGLPSSWEAISGDFDGDGKTDYGRLGGTGAWWSYGSANGTFTEPNLENYQVELGPWANFGQPSQWQTIVGNFDGDLNPSTNKPIMDYARLADTGAWIFYGNANRSFTVVFQDYTGINNFGFPSSYQVTTGDFDNDSRTDYIRLGADRSYIFYGNPKPGRGFTWRLQSYPVGWNFTGFGLATGDFNRDNRTDYARLGDDNAYIYLATATRGSFNLNPQGYNDGTHVPLHFGVPSSWETINGDFNGDGYADYGRIADTGAWFFYGTSTGASTIRFQNYNGLNFGFPSSYRTIVGNFDTSVSPSGRKMTDYARLGDDNAYFFYGSTSLGGFGSWAQEYPRHFSLPSPFSTVSGDFNGDGYTDYARLGGVFEHSYFRCTGGIPTSCGIATAP